MQFLDFAEPQGHVAFLPFGPIILKSLKPKPYEEDPRSLGAYLKRRRLELGLRQEDMAARLGVTKWGYALWEKGSATPTTIRYKCIVEFLGCYPHPAPRALGQLLLKVRRFLGLTSREAAQLIGVDQGTILKWERGAWTDGANSSQD